MSDQTIAHIIYRNWKGVTRVRHVRPLQWYHGVAPPWHPEPQWLMRGVDLETGEERTFALADVVRWLKPGEEG